MQFLGFFVVVFYHGLQYMMHGMTCMRRNIGLEHLYKIIHTLR